MATTTATIFVGKSHPNDGGINPTHLIRFTENDRPALILIDLEGKEEEKVIIPTLENTIDDIYLMIGVFILKKIKPSKKINNKKRDSLYEILEKTERIELYEKTVKLINEFNIKVVVNILESSHLLHIIEQIKKYPNDFEVTITSMKKEYDRWSNSIKTIGL
jgi:hypothetical protein